LQHEIKTEGKLKFADDYQQRLVSTQCDQIAAADFALDPEPKGFEVSLDGSIEACLGPP
jgi:hypothetical protein